MFRSIRFTFLFSYGLLFVVLLGAFGATAYLRLRRSAFRSVELRLDAQAQMLVGALEEMNDGSVDLEIPRSTRRLFAGGDDAPYYAVWGRDGKLIARSPATLEVERPANAGRRAKGSRLDIAVDGPAGTRVLVGKRIGRELEELREFLAALLSAGAAFIAVGLGGGWWLVGRALRPIDRISRAAAAVSASNLSERIDVAQTKTELGRLAVILNQTFERLQKSFEAQARFGADASHELRTPLTVILTSAELALRRERSPAEYRESMQDVLAAATRMKELVEGLLTLARADGAFRKEASDLGALARETADQLAPLAAERNVSLRVQAVPAGVTADRERLREAIRNLVTNAIRYTPAGGRVELEVAVEDGAARLRIADSGIGIPEKDQPRVFERFFRSDAARSRDQGGAGLGLAITKGIVEAHGGTITFRSREGAGTTFEIRLPTV